MADDSYGSVMKVAVFSIMFVAIFAILVNGVGNILDAGDVGEMNEMKAKEFSKEQFAQMEWWNYENSPGYGINMTGGGSSIIGTYFSAPSEVLVGLANLGDWFAGPDTDATPDGLRWETDDYEFPHQVRLYPLEGGTWVVYRQGGGWDRWDQWIEPRDIINNLIGDIADGQSATISVTVGVQVSVVFSFPAGVDPRSALANNGPYSVAVGQTMIDQTYNMGDAWTVVGQLLTFSLDTTGVWWIDYLASGVVWASLVMVGFYMINRLLDHIPFT
jgi:hypothetical protein